MSRKIYEAKTKNGTRYYGKMLAGKLSRPMSRDRVTEAMSFHGCQIVKVCRDRTGTGWLHQSTKDLLDQSRTDRAVREETGVEVKIQPWHVVEKKDGMFLEAKESKDGTRVVWKMSGGKYGDHKISEPKPAQGEWITDRVRAHWRGYLENGRKESLVDQVEALLSKYGMNAVISTVCDAALLQAGELEMEKDEHPGNAEKRIAFEKADGLAEALCIAARRAVPVQS